MMPLAEFLAIGEAVCGPDWGWRRRYAKALGVPYSTMRQVSGAFRPVPREWAARALALKDASAGPQGVRGPGEARAAADDASACAKALAARLRALAAEARAVGWQPRAVQLALLGLAGADFYLSQKD